MTHDNEIPSRIEIRHPRNAFVGGATQVWATVGREEIQVFFYDAKQLQFSKEELEGLTIQEMRDLLHQRQKETA